VLNAKLLVTAEVTHPGGVYLVVGDGRRHLLFAGAQRGRWSADGQLIARLQPGGHFDSYGGQSTKLVSSRPDGSGRDVFTLRSRGTGSPYSVDSFEWVPGGHRIAVGAVVSDGEEPPHTLFVAQRDGSDMTQPTWSCSLVASPSFSPDAQQLAYACGDELRIARANGSASRPARHVPPFEVSISPAGVLRWRPDGHQIAIGLSDEHQNPSIQLLGVHGAHTTRPTRTLPGAEDLTWSPDSRYYAYALSDDHHGGVVIARASDGTIIRRITLPGAYTVDWQP
jgi:dipeptidyl aminopeptidase/acylaminoacyl peptidase